MNIYKVDISCRSYAVGFAILFIVMLPVFIWVAASLLHSLPMYLEKHAFDQLAVALVVILLAVVLAVGGIYFFIPPLAEVEHLEIEGDAVRIKRVTLPVLTFPLGTEFTVKRILIPNYTEDKARKNFEAHLYISWPIVFVLSERIKGYEDIRKLIEQRELGA